MSGDTERFGHFEVLALLGRGGMGEVHRARVVAGPRSGRLVALKRLLAKHALDPEYVDLFTSEADVTRLLRHPNIVEVYEVGCVGDVYYMAMELIDGRDVGQILRRCKTRGLPWPIDFAAYVACTLLEALDYAHNAVGPTGKPLDVLHCDVSPSNLFVSRTGDLKLGDFGVSRARALGVTDAEILGKPYYFSPEGLEGQLSPAVDLWAATVTLYELLTLERPFNGKTQTEVFDAIRAGRYVPVRSLRPDVPPALEGLVDRGFSPEPSVRFSTARSYAEALRPLYDERIGTPLAISALVRGLFNKEPPR